MVSTSIPCSSPILKKTGHGPPYILAPVWGGQLAPWATLCSSALASGES